MKTINLYEKNVYGRICIYIADQDFAKTIAQLTGKKTLDHKDVDALVKLGFKVNLIKLVG
jgi:hypothetical protein